MIRAALLLLALAGCAARPPESPAAPEPVQPCRIRPVTVSNRDFFSPATLTEIRRVNRELRLNCAG
ncbi:hypothetical protein [Roseococcus sp.]|uniref:hypothetical protein n=1 Tax=Roseococcus sp. TaxID=2109646 RepID=UPI003BAA7449